MNFYLEKINETKRQVLENLLEYYVYEFSPYLHIDVNEEGKYGFTLVNEYVTEPQYSSYFIKHNEHLIGFVIVKELYDQDFNFCIEQFFIFKKYNGKGFGKKAAIEAFDLFKGKWQITQTETNYPAQAFWRSVIKEYTKNQFTEFYDDKRRSVQRFENS